MSNHTVSGWQKASTVAACLQVIVVGFSLCFIWSQLRQQKLQLAQQTLQLDQQVKLSRAVNVQEFVNLISPLNLKLAEDREMAKLWLKGQKGLESGVDPTGSEIEKYRYTRLLAYFLIFYENVYTQHQNGLVDEEVYSGWDKDLKSFIEEQHLADYWDERKSFYQKDFSNHVDQLIKSGMSARAPKQ